MIISIGDNMYDAYCISIEKGFLKIEYGQKKVVIHKILPKKQIKQIWDYIRGCLEHSGLVDISEFVGGRIPRKL